MAASVLEQYRIADFLNWHAQAALKLNPHFQRRAVWTRAAKVFLIDTILRRFPIPKVFMRTNVNIETHATYREVVDGQQRLRTIIEFAADEWPLTARAGEFNGVTYSALPDEMKERFLTYPIAVEQLVNASDDDVLAMFARLNTYNVALSPAELRHAKFQGEFKWAVHQAATRWRTLWDDYGIVSVRQRLRMQEDALMAEMFGIVLEGIQDGGRKALNALYAKYDERFPQLDEVTGRVDEVAAFVDRTFKLVIIGTPLAKPPTFLLLFAAVLHALHGIPPGALGDALPPRDPEALADFDQTKANLVRLAAALAGGANGGHGGHLTAFVQATRENTRAASNRVQRFPVIWRALLGEPL
jgi:hypothetical protein